MNVTVDTVVEGVQGWYDWMMSEADPRTADWMLMSSPLPTLAGSAAYLIIVSLGIQFMKNRQPFQFNKILVLYNFLLACLNGYMFYEFVYNGYKEKLSWTCADINRDPSNTHSLRLAKAVWWFYFSKCIEFFDTFFFVLRKKNNQITFLHLYHHSTMFPLWWMGVRWAAGGQSVYSSAINCLVHVIMYSYYMLSAMGPSVRKYLWWKKYLTMFQLFQFCFIFGTTIIAIFEVRKGKCNFYEWMGWSNCFYMVTMLALFGNFYIQTYNKKQKDKKEKKEREAQEKKVQEEAKGKKEKKNE
eukprot:m.26088 g.26088  ORF g.26088 m.26088 type:complete len:299 (+) comp9237_c0_seq1:18-914(+)